MKYKISLAGVIMALIIMTTLAFSSGILFAPQLGRVAQAAPLNANDDVLAAYENALSRLYRSALPSVVRIDVSVQLSDNNSPNAPRPFTHPSVPGRPDIPDEFFGQGQGSGFVWDKKGHIITNYHVIKNAKSVEVSFADGTSASAEVIGGDPDADLAVLKVDLPANQLRPLPLGDSDALQVGQLTFAIGTPFGQDFTLTSGIVSAVERTIHSGNSPYSIPEVIQTDASINPGNSGGPLLNRHGEVIGINTQILSRSGSNAGIGFAVPINTAKQVVPSLIKGGAYQYAWLGISGNTLSDDVANLMNLPAGTKGALVLQLADGGPAEKAGMAGSDSISTIKGMKVAYGGDVIIAANKQPIESMDDLIAYLIEDTHPGDKVTFTVLRKGQQKNITVTLGTRPKQ